MAVKKILIGALTYLVRVGKIFLKKWRMSSERKKGKMISTKRQ